MDVRPGSRSCPKLAPLRLDAIPPRYPDTLTHVEMREIATIRFRDQESGDLGVVIIKVDAERRFASLTTSLRQDGDVQATFDAGTLEQVMRALMEARHQMGSKPTELNVPAPEAFIGAIKTIVEFIAAGDFGAAIAAAPGTRLTGQDLAAAVSEYGARIVPVPDHGLRQIEVTKVDGAEVPTWHVAVPMWSQEEGRSDLTLELWIKHIGHGLYAAEILNLHVL